MDKLGNARLVTLLTALVASSATVAESRAVGKELEGIASQLSNQKLPPTEADWSDIRVKVRSICRILEIRTRDLQLLLPDAGDKAEARRKALDEFAGSLVQLKHAFVVQEMLHVHAILSGCLSVKRDHSGRNGMSPWFFRFWQIQGRIADVVKDLSQLQLLGENEEGRFLQDVVFQGFTKLFGDPDPLYWVDTLTAAA